jgi:hypothetical protein
MVPSLIPSFLGKPVPLYPAIGFIIPERSGVVGKGPPLLTSIGSSETDPTVVGVSEQLETSLVDNDTMVEPTQCKKIGRICGPTLRPGDGVMSLEPIAALTTVRRTHPAVAVDDGSLEGRRDSSASSAVLHETAVLCVRDHFGGGIAEDRFQGHCPHLGS